jgi:hypothetical protein
MKIMFLGRQSSGQRIRLKTLPPSVSQVSRYCGILNISQPYRSPRPVMGIALICFLAEFTVSETSKLDFGTKFQALQLNVQL